MSSDTAGRGSGRSRLRSLIDRHYNRQEKYALLMALIILAGALAQVTIHRPLLDEFNARALEISALEDGCGMYPPRLDDGRYLLIKKNCSVECFDPAWIPFNCTYPGKELVLIGLADRATNSLFMVFIPSMVAFLVVFVAAMREEMLKRRRKK